MSPASRRPTGGSGASKKAATKGSSPEAPKGDAEKDAAPPEETGEADAGDRAAAQPPRRSSALHPERVWPD